jgi:Flp pilus assembly protein TadB
MFSSDFLLSLASICFVICAIPQLIRNWKFKDTLTQSIMTNSFILTGTVLSIIAYIQLHLTIALLFLILEAVITIILLIQILVWRNNKKMIPKIKETEEMRTAIRILKGVK